MSTSLPVVDSLAFVGESLFGPAQTPENLFAALDDAAIGSAVLAPQRPADYALSAANEAVAHLVAEAPERRRQLGRVDPNHRHSLEEIRRCVDEFEVSGFYLNPREEVFAINGSTARATLDAIAEAALPVVVETGVPWVSEALQVAEVAAQYPQIPFILTNGAQFNISGLGQEEAFMTLHECPNTYINTAGVYRQDFIENVVRLHGARRVLFASCSPAFQPSYEVLRALGASLSPTDRRALLHDSARALFWGERADNY